MKKNLISIIILALLVVNIILSTALVFFVLPSVSKTNNILNRVSSIIDIELGTRNPNNTNKVPIENISTYSFKDKLIVYLKQSEPEPDMDYKKEIRKHYAMLSIALSIDKEHEHTKTYEPLIADHEKSIEEIVTEEFSRYTIDEIQDNKDKIKEDSLQRIQELFNSNFIINISFGNITLE